MPRLNLSDLACRAGWALDFPSTARADVWSRADHEPDSRFDADRVGPRSSSGTPASASRAISSWSAPRKAATISTRDRLARISRRWSTMLPTQRRHVLGATVLEHRAARGSPRLQFRRGERPAVRRGFGVRNTVSVDGHGDADRAAVQHGRRRRSRCLRLVVGTRPGPAKR